MIMFIKKAYETVGNFYQFTQLHVTDILKGQEGKDV